MTHNEKKESPLTGAVHNLKKGDLIVVFYGNYSYRGIFLNLKNQTSGYEGSRMHYHSLYNHNMEGNSWIAKNLDACRKGTGTLRKDYVNARAEERTLKIEENMLSVYEKEYYNAVKSLV